MLHAKSESHTAGLFLSPKGVLHNKARLIRTNMPTPRLQNASINGIFMLGPDATYVMMQPSEDMFSRLPKTGNHVVVYHKLEKGT